MAINLSRNTRLWVSTVTSGHNNSNTFEIPLQEDYSLSQSVTTADVTVEEAGPTPTRGSKRFNNSLDPVDWNFSTYFTPYLDTNHYTVDMLLWHALANAEGTATDFDNSGASSTVYGDTNGLQIAFTNNSAHVLTKINLYFKIDNQMYLVTDAQVSQAEISIDISDIGQIAWSGQGLTYNPIADPAFVDSDGSNGLALDEDTPTADKYVKIPSNKKYLVNKLTIMDLQSDMAPDANNNYDIPITSASVSINNNVTYLTPNTLSEVDSPIGSFTGTFDVTGSVEAYLKDTGGDGTVGTPYGSAELLQHMLANVGDAVSNAANIVLNIGGTSGARAIITIPTAHITVPEVAVEDVVSQSFEFKAIPTSTQLASGDELTIEIKAQ